MRQIILGELIQSCFFHRSSQFIRKIDRHSSVHPIGDTFSHPVLIRDSPCPDRKAFFFQLLNVICIKHIHMGTDLKAIYCLGLPYNLGGWIPEQVSNTYICVMFS